MNTHGNVWFNARTYRDWIGLTRDDVVLAIAPLFHITGLVGHLAVAMLTPMPLVLAYRFDAAETLRLAERHGATFTIAAITAFIALLRDRRRRPAGAARGLQRRRADRARGRRGLRAALRRLHPQHLRAHRDDLAVARRAVRRARARSTRRRARCRSASRCSRRTRGSSTRTGEEVPVGELGEIATAGPQVVPGYWNGVEARRDAVSHRRRRVRRRRRLVLRRRPQEGPDQRRPATRSGRARSRTSCTSTRRSREVAVVGVPDDYRGETVKAFVGARAGAGDAGGADRVRARAAGRVQAPAAGRDPGRAAEDRDDVRMLVEDVLDLARPDLVARRVDLVLLAVDDVEPAVGVHEADVARAEHARAAPVPVAGDDLWAGGDDLRDLAGRQLLAVLADDPRVGVEDRDADRQRARARVDRRPRRDRDGMRRRRRLGQPVDVVDVGAEAPLERLDDRGRDRRAAGVDLASARAGRRRRWRSSAMKTVIAAIVNVAPWRSASRRVSAASKR